MKLPSKRKFSASTSQSSKRRKRNVGNAHEFQSLEPRNLLAGVIDAPLGPANVGIHQLSWVTNAAGYHASGTLFQDDNLNGVKNSHEPSLSNWVVFADSNANGQFDSGEPRSKTNNDGSFQINNLIAPHAILPLLNNFDIVDSISSEKRVNTETRFFQGYSDVAVHDNGSVIVWASVGQDSSAWGVYGQRYDVDGNKLGSEFRVNASIASSQLFPSVSAHADGRFVVAFQDANADGSGWGSYAQNFAADGTPVGGQRRVNETTFGNQYRPNVKVLDNGNVVVGWQGLGRQTSHHHSQLGRGVFTRLFDADLNPLGMEIRVSPTNFATSQQFDIAALPGGRFAVAFQGNYSPDNNGVYVRTMNAMGFMEGGATLVNQHHRAGVQWQPAIAVNDRGDMVVTWTTATGDGSGSTVYAQQLAPDLQLKHGPTRVAEEWRGTQWRSDVVFLPDGGFATTWQGRGGNDHDGVFVRQFDDHSNPMGTEYRMSESKTGLQRHAAMAAGGAGLVMAWHGKGATDNLGVYSRFISITTNFGVLSGIVFDDLNGNGRLDGGLVGGDNPDVVFVIDRSGSTSSTFAGSAVGDLNNDGSANTVLDAEIAGFEALVDELIRLGKGDIARVTAVSFGSSAQRMNATPLTPNQDSDGNGRSDIKDLLRTLIDGGSTNFEAALQTSITVFNDLGTSLENGNLIFLSDGFPDSSSNYADEVATLNGLINNVRAFRVGSNSSLPALQIIDPAAIQFLTTDELLSAFGGIGSGGGGGGGGGGFEPGLANVTVYIDQNDNGVLDPGERFIVTVADDPATSADEGGRYEFGRMRPGQYKLRAITPGGRTRTTPMDDFYMVDVALGSIISNLNFGFTDTSTTA